MNPNQIAERLVALCRQGDYAAAQSELYADDAVSIEPEGTPQPRAQGREALAAKGKIFSEMFEIHGSTVSDPVVAGTFFSCAMAVDVTPRAGGPRFIMAEVCVYEVRDGKIASEQFFYPPQP